MAATRLRQIWAALAARSGAVRSVVAATGALRRGLDDVGEQLRRGAAEADRLTGELDAARGALATHERVLGPLRRSGALSLLRRVAPRDGS